MRTVWRLGSMVALSMMLFGGDASADAKKDCRDRCFKEYNKCRKKGRGCIDDKQACDKTCK